MNLKNRIEELERKFPSIRDMEAECVYADGHTEWLTLDAMKRDLDVITINRFRNCSLPGLDKWLQLLKEAAYTKRQERKIDNELQAQQNPRRSSAGWLPAFHGCNDE